MATNDSKSTTDRRRFLGHHSDWRSGRESWLHSHLHLQLMQKIILFLVKMMILMPGSIK